MNDIVQSQIKLQGFIVKKAIMNINTDLINQAEDREVDIKIFFENRINQNANGFITDFNLDLITKSKSLDLSLLFEFNFETSNQINTEYLKSTFCNINAPAIAFPMIRAFVTTITANSGIPPIMLPSINFAAHAVGKENTK
jgi:preprotein translocase subunit SecB